MAFFSRKPFILKFAMIAALIWFAVPPQFAGSGPDLLREARSLYQAENDYMTKCLADDWDGIYAYQHPVFRQKVTIEEFKFYDGKVEHNYREGLRARVSGGYTLPPLEYIKNNTEKKDLLGFPAQRKYQVTTNPLVDVTGFEVESVALSADGQRAKVFVRYHGTMILEPAVVRGAMRIPFNYTAVDYWEKVDGKWSIALLMDTRHVSGNTTFYFRPADSEDWERMNFETFPESRLKPEKS